jgi:arylsulfatase A-like enzyme
LNALAARGASSERAYAHTPHTFASRAQLFGGTLTPRAEQRTLVDDFAALGYQVAHFSGQDDSFAGSARYLGSARADHYYDARQDLARHTGRGTSAGALQVSWKRVEERVAEFLDGRQDDRPLFMYLNLVDTHFPFDHAELDPILGAERLERGEIREANRARVVAAYQNCAANVDRGIERIAARLRARAPGELAIVVTADHGEALYEEGYLGHGQDLDDAQTRVPFIVAGIGGRWPEPLGVADVRGLLLQNLQQPGPPRLEPEPRHRLFQYLSRIDIPRQIALRGVDSQARYDFRSADFTGDASAREPLIWTWEALARRDAGEVQAQAQPTSGALAHSTPEAQAD